jgi:hypothetical protein
MKKVLLLAVVTVLGMSSCGGVSPEEADKVCVCYTELNETKSELDQENLEKKLQECEQMMVSLQEKDMKSFENMKNSCAALKD